MMTPLIDVIFLLMIFFIMTLNFLVPEGVLENRLPDQAKTKAYEREKDWELVRIHVARGKAGPQIYLQERRIAGLSDLLLNLHRLPRDVIIVIEPEEKVAYKHVMDSALICHFYPFEYQHMASALSAAGGWDVDRQEVDSIGQRIANLARLYLLREGFTHADDTISARAFFPTKEGPIAGKTLNPDELAQAMQVYFEKMGWDGDGVPSPECLAELKLSKYI